MKRLIEAAAILALATVSVRAEILSMKTLPGGSAEQVQYQHNGNFAGVPGSSVSGSTLTVTEVHASTAAFGLTPNVSTFTKSGELDMAANAPMKLSGASGYVTSASSVNASSFFGDGSHLTGIPSTGAYTSAIAVETAARIAQDIAIGADTQTLHTEIVPVSRINLSTVTTALSLKADDSSVVHLTGAENISGAKTFTATGNTQYSLATSSGISVGGPVVAAGTIRANNSGANTFSIVTSSGIKTTQINWADGTVSTTAASGGGGAPGAVIASGTVSGGAVGVLAGSIAAGTTLYFDSAGLIVNKDATNNAAVISVKNLTFVASTTTYPSGTTTATSLGACIANSTATWTQGNNHAQVCFAGGTSASTQVMLSAIPIIDGGFPKGYDASHGIPCTTNTGNLTCNMSFCVDAGLLSAGQHNACLAMATNTGTLTIPASGALASGASMSVYEQATGGAGYSVPVSTSGLFSTASHTTMSYGACVGSTYTVTGSGAAFEGSLTVTGTVSSGLGNNKYWLLMDGAPISPWTSSSPMIVQAGANSGQTNTLTMPFRVASPSAGTHNFCVTGTQQTGDSLVCGSGPCYIKVTETKNSAGTGDASTNGKNNFSGANTFSGTMYGQQTASAIVVFNSAGTVSYSVNVTSVTHVTTGKYLINFTNQMADTNYAPICMGGTGGNGYAGRLTNGGTVTRYQFPLEALNSAATNTDVDRMTCIVFGNGPTAP